MEPNISNPIPADSLASPRLPQHTVELEPSRTVRRKGSVADMLMRLTAHTASSRGKAREQQPISPPQQTLKSSKSMHSLRTGQPSLPSNRRSHRRTLSNPRLMPPISRPIALPVGSAQEKRFTSVGAARYDRAHTPASRSGGSFSSSLLSDSSVGSGRSTEISDASNVCLGKSRRPAPLPPSQAMTAQPRTKRGPGIPATSSQNSAVTQKPTTVAPRAKANTPIPPRLESSEPGNESLTMPKVRRTPKNSRRPNNQVVSEYLERKPRSLETGNGEVMGLGLDLRGQNGKEIVAFTPAPASDYTAIEPLSMSHSPQIQQEQVGSEQDQENQYQENQYQENQYQENQYQENQCQENHYQENQYKEHPKQPHQQAQRQLTKQPQVQTQSQAQRQRQKSVVMQSRRPQQQEKQAPQQWPQNMGQQSLKVEQPQHPQLQHLQEQRQQRQQQQRRQQQQLQQQLQAQRTTHRAQQMRERVAELQNLTKPSLYTKAEDSRTPEIEQTGGLEDISPSVSPLNTPHMGSANGSRFSSNSTLSSQTQTQELAALKQNLSMLESKYNVLQEQREHDVFNLQSISAELNIVQASRDSLQQQVCAYQQAQQSMQCRLELLQKNLTRSQRLVRVLGANLEDSKVALEEKNMENYALRRCLSRAARSKVHDEDPDHHNEGGMLSPPNSISDAGDIDQDSDTPTIRE